MVVHLWHCFNCKKGADGWMFPLTSLPAIFLNRKEKSDVWKWNERHRLTSASELTLLTNHHMKKTTEQLQPKLWSTKKFSFTSTNIILSIFYFWHSFLGLNKSLNGQLQPHNELSCSWNRKSSWLSARVCAKGGDQTGSAAHVFAVCLGPVRHGWQRASTRQEGEFTHLSVASVRRKFFVLTQTHTHIHKVLGFRHWSFLDLFSPPKALTESL